jgi:hypothetical protein
MEQTRTALANGQLMQPQFSPAKVVGTEYCEKWRHEKVCALRTGSPADIF